MRDAANWWMRYRWTRTTFVGATPNRTGRIRGRNSMSELSKVIVIRQLDREDAHALVALESQCREAARWGEAGYWDIGINGIAGWAATRDSAVQGFVLVRALADEMEILNLAVD